jgi:hypothetical protein
MYVVGSSYRCQESTTYSRGRQLCKHASFVSYPQPVDRHIQNGGDFKALVSVSSIEGVIQSKFIKT